MVKTLITTILSAIAMLAATSLALAADTLADMDIIISPELYAQGISVGEKHPVAGELFHPQAQPQFIRNLPLGPVVYIGDSIIAFLPAGLLPRNSINLAVSGATTGDIIAQELQHIPRNASRVVIEGGINDMLNPNLGNNTAANYGAIIAGLPKSAKVSVVGILPVNEAQLATNRDFLQFVDNTKIAAVNAQIAPLCTGRCSVVPTPAGIQTSDGIHPTVAGQAVLAKALR